MTPTEKEKKQQLLRRAGYNVTIGGPWGPWQEQQYQKTVKAVRPQTKEEANRLSRGNAVPITLANPGVAIGTLGTLGTLGSTVEVTLPTLAGLSSAAPFAIPAAATLAGPLYGAYELATGQTHITPTTMKQDQARAYSSDATRVNRPMSISIPRTYNWSNSKPIGEMYVNPAVVSEESVLMSKRRKKNKKAGATTAPAEDTPVAGAPAEGTPVTGEGTPVTGEGTATGTATSPTPPEQNSEKKDEQKEEKQEESKTDNTKTDNTPKNEVKTKKGFSKGFNEGFRIDPEKLGRVTGRVLKYGIPLSVVGGGAYLGAKAAFTENKTAQDSLLDNSIKAIVEMDKALQTKRNYQKVDSLSRLITNSPQNAPATTTGTVQQPTPRDTVAVPDTINPQQQDQAIKAFFTRQ